MNKVKHEKIVELLSSFKYISHNIEAKANHYTVDVPPFSGESTRSIRVVGLKKSVAVRNKIGKRIWGKYWSAVLSGYIDTIKNPTASVGVYRHLDKRYDKWEWRVVCRGLRDNKPRCKSFSESRYGAVQAKILADGYAGLLTESRLEQLSEWKPRWIRRPRGRPESPYRNRGTLATK